MSVQRLFLPQNDLQDKLITFIEQNAALLLTTILKKNSRLHRATTYFFTQSSLYQL